MNKLPNELINDLNFNNLYSLRPSGSSKVIVYNKETDEFYDKTIFRNYRAYLKVPEFDPSVKKSYMYCEKEQEVPKELESFVNFAKSLDSRYNQMVVNWYEPKEYIELHSDCTSKFVSKDSPILTINLNENDKTENIRSMIFKQIDGDDIFSVPLINNSYILIDNNLTHRHCVNSGAGKRISITFRMIKD